MLFTALLVGACNKKSADPTGVYAIHGVQDVTIERGNIAAMALVVEHKEGPQGIVNLAISGLPNGVTAAYNPGNSGTPSFSTAVTFSAIAQADTGTFPVSVEAKSDQMGNKSYQMKLHIKKAPDCSAERIGNYATSEVCSSTQYTYTSSVTAGNTENRIMFPDFAEFAGLNIYADLECLTNTIAIPTQTANGITVSGSGSYSVNQMVIHYTATQDSITVSCTMTMNKL